MLHAYAVKFDVTENLENFLDFGVNYMRPSTSANCPVLCFGVRNERRTMAISCRVSCFMEPWKGNVDEQSTSTPSSRRDHTHKRVSSMHPHPLQDVNERRIRNKSCWPGQAKEGSFRDMIKPDGTHI
jgi:hypothetical protein